MEVKVLIEFGFNTNKQMFEAQIRVYLPIEESEWPDIKLHQLLRNPDKTIGELPLEWWIGIFDETTKCKVIQYKIASETLKELEEKVEKELKEIERTLKETYWENVKNIRLLPEPREYVIKLE